MHRRLALVALAILLMTGCTVSSPAQPAPPPASSSAMPPPKLRVQVNVWALQWLAQEIGGDLVQVDVFEAKPHDAPTPDDLTRLRDADAVIYLGGLSKEVKETLDPRAQADPTRFQDLSEVGSIGFKPAPPELGDDALPGGDDPHVWLDLKRMEQVAGAVARALRRAVDQHPAYREAVSWHTEELNKRLENANRRLSELHRKLADKLKGCKGKTMVPEHPAYQYFAESFELKQFPVSRASTPSPDAERYQEELKALWDKEGNRSIFYERAKGNQGKRPDEERQRVEKLANDLGAFTWLLSSLEAPPERFDDGKERDYPAAVEHDVDTVRKGLKC